MVAHVARRALAAGAREVWVATDDARIAAALEGFDGVRVAMTRSDHVSGTDRLAECARLAGWGEQDIVVNLQGDEPFALGCRASARWRRHWPPVARRWRRWPPRWRMRRPCSTPTWSSWCAMRWATRQSQPRPHSVAPRRLCPFARRAAAGAMAAPHWYLRLLARLPAVDCGDAALEQAESLEQLRVLEAGFRIAVALSPEPFPPGIDTPEDLARRGVDEGRRVVLLVVCLGNICRSPMGEGALRAAPEASSLAGRVEVDLAGTSGWHRAVFRPARHCLCRPPRRGYFRLVCAALAAQGLSVFRPNIVCRPPQPGRRTSAGATGGLCQALAVL